MRREKHELIERLRRQGFTVTSTRGGIWVADEGYKPLGRAVSEAGIRAPRRASRSELQPNTD